ncbi:queuosine precursor transporter [Dongia deserti]|uniref:queuosine precursor transporter n=1 Tax=Dongia deserti TaxID=2268030 RepID=UPI000E655997|nr:queuosine precursor transporter [Dongia deserti]
MFAELVAGFNALPTESMLVIELVVVFSLIPLMLRPFGAAGMFIFVAVGIIAANVQVLKSVSFYFYDAPIPLGTVVFSATYIATDVLTEYYGRPVARKAVWLGFAAMLLMTIMMLLVMGYKPMTPEVAHESGMDWALPNHDHILALYLPQATLLIAGLSSYLISQFNDIFLFQKIRKWTGRGQLWVRSCGSTAVSALIDNTVFSTLAWMVFPWLLGQHDQVVDLDTLIFSFILGTYWIRLAMALLEVPTMYAARWFLPEEDRRAYDARDGGPMVAAAA